MITSTFRLKIALCAIIALAACNKSGKEDEATVTGEHDPDSANKNPTEDREATEQDDPRVKCPSETKQIHLKILRADDIPTISIRCEHENGLADGPHKTWTTSGVLLLDENYVQGQIDGVQRTWHSNGSPSSEATFRNGKYEGRARTWHPNGKLARELFFHSDEPTGVEREWDEKGHLIKAHHPGSKTKGTGDMQRARE